MSRRGIFFICLALLFGAGCPSVQAQDAPPIVGRDVRDPAKRRLKIPAHMVPNYRDEMREIVITLSKYAKGRNKKFLVIAHNGIALLKRGDWERKLEELKLAFKIDFLKKGILATGETTPPEAGTTMRRYLLALDGLAVDEMFCPGDRDFNPVIDQRIEMTREKFDLDEKTKNKVREQGIRLLSIDHCKTEEKAFTARVKAARDDILAYADTDLKGKFRDIPKSRPFGENAYNIETLGAARNIHIMQDSRDYKDKEFWRLDLEETNFDILVIDPFFRKNQPLTADDVHALKFKKFGSRRLVLAWVSLSVAEDSRYYWEPHWRIGEPKWLRSWMPESDGATMVEYWNPAWKEIVGKTFKGLVDLGFDGVILDDLTAHKHFEELTPID